MPGSTVIELLVFGLGEEIVRLSCFIKSHVSRGGEVAAKQLTSWQHSNTNLGTPVLFQGMHDQIFSEGMVFKQKILCLHLLVDIVPVKTRICLGLPLESSAQEGVGRGRRVAQFSVGAPSIFLDVRVNDGHQLSSGCLSPAP